MLPSNAIAQLLPSETWESYLCSPIPPISESCGSSVCAHSLSDLPTPLHPQGLRSGSSWLTGLPASLSLPFYKSIQYKVILTSPPTHKALDQVVISFCPQNGSQGMQGVGGKRRTLSNAHAAAISPPWLPSPRAGMLKSLPQPTRLSVTWVPMISGILATTILPWSFHSNGLELIPGPRTSSLSFLLRAPVPCSPLPGTLFSLMPPSLTSFRPLPSGLYINRNPFRPGIRDPCCFFTGTCCLPYSLSPTTHAHTRAHLSPMRAGTLSVCFIPWLSPAPRTNNEA